MKLNLSNIARTLSAAALMMSMAFNADAQWRKTWDFSQGVSAETAANLNADPNWGANRTDADGNTTGWKDNVKMSGTLMANGEPIAEFNGLDFQTSGLKGGDYLIDPTSFRMSRKGMAFKLPPVIGGQTITMVAKSANATATNRGFKGDENLEYIEGPADGICLGPDGYQTLVWRVKESVTDSVAVQLTTDPDGGLDIQLIMIDKGDGPGVEEAKKVAYVTNGESEMFDDAFYALDGASDQVELTLIESTVTDVDLDSLQKFEAVVISPTVGVGDAMVAVLKSAIAYQPVLNLNPALYSTWALGEIVETDTPVLTVGEAYMESPLFADIDISEGLALQIDGGVPAVKLGSYFADDAVIATAGEGNVAIHQHNADRNSYLFVPVSADVMNPEVLNGLVVNGTVMVAATKKAVTATNTPSILQGYDDNLTTVTINAAKGANIYYTLDGTEPTVESTVYTEPFVLKENTTVMAIATLDGYLQSKTATADVVVKSKAHAPVFSMSKDANSTTVTISCDTEGVDIYYAFWNTGDLTPETSTLYTEPIVLSVEPSYIYAYAAGGDYITSDMADDYVAIESINANTIRMDTVSHFSASEAAWFPAEPAEGGEGKASAWYYWGKNAWSYYSEEVIGTETKEEYNEETGETTTVEVPIYAVNPEAVRTQEANEGTENDWRLFSQGQVLTGELQLGTVATVGNGAANRFHEEATDLIGGPASKGAITFGGKGSGEPYTGAIESTVKFAAPFDVVVYVGNGNNGSAAQMEVQVSADGKEWTKAGDLALAATQRYIKKNRISVDEGGEQYVRIAHVGGGTKGQVYDIYVLNNGEVSKQYVPGTSGIEEVVSEAAAEVKSVEVYTLNGMRVAEPRKGINIIRTVMTDGKVKVEKVIVR